MRLISFKHQGKPGYGALVNGGIVDLGSRLQGIVDMKSLIAGNAADEAAALCTNENIDFAMEDVELDIPVPNPGKIFCIGVNYFNRNDEYMDNSAQPKYPSIFVRTAESFVAHEKPMLRPPESEQLDYEGEITIVIGKGGRRIPEDQAESHIFGLTLMNDGSLRDWLRHAKFNVTQGKNFDKSGSLGPAIVTSDEFSGFDDLHITTRVNGEVRQNDTTANLLFPFRYIVSYVSTFSTLHPGDIIATGTPTGAGARFDPPKWLVPGDVVEVEAPGIGVLRNSIEDEQV